MKTEFDAVMTRINYWYVVQSDEITEDDLHDLEQEIGYPLPTDYRTFLMKYGFAAGKGDTRFTNSENPEEVETSVGVFYGLKAGESYDLRSMRETFADRLPDHLLPFTSGSGGEFCLSLAGDDVGRVYWWFQETGPVESLDDLEPIAESFKAFVNSLVCVDE